MAQRRMFSKLVTNSSNFLMMPQSAQNLYFHFGMNADDDGFCEHFTVMRMTDSKPDDLKILQAKGFVQVFDDRVLVILNWKENNYIQADRYTPSKYLSIYKKELKMIAEGQTDPCIQDVYKVDTQVRLGKVRLGKDRIDKVSIISNEVETSLQEKYPVNEFISLFEPINPSYERLFPLKMERNALERLIAKHGEEKLRHLLEELPEVLSLPYAPRISKPTQLENKLGELLQFMSQERSKNAQRVAIIPGD